MRKSRGNLHECETCWEGVSPKVSRKPRQRLIYVFLFFDIPSNIPTNVFGSDVLIRQYCLYRFKFQLRCRFRYCHRVTKMIFVTCRNNYPASRTAATTCQRLLLFRCGSELEELLREVCNSQANQRRQHPAIELHFAHQFGFQFAHF